MVYYRHSGEEQHLSFVIISGCLQHDTIAVFQFQSSLLSFLKETLPCKPKKIIYFSDGAVKIGKIFSTYATMKMILESKQNGTFLQHHMAKVRVMGLEVQLSG